MDYSELVDVYEQLGKTAGRLDKTVILAEFFKKVAKKGNSKWLYLLYGKVLPDYDSREFGISRQLVIKALASAYGISSESIEQKFRKIGDLGEIAESLYNERKQSVLFKKKLTIDFVFDTLSKIIDIDGKGSVDRKIALISEILASASAKEAKYVARTLLADLRVGVAQGVIRDAMNSAFFGNDSEMADKIEAAYDMANDISRVFDACAKGKKELDKIGLEPGRPMNVMLAVKSESIDEGFEVCGRPAAIEQKYDGFRMLINKKDGKITLFTRKLENVTAQFPDVVEAALKHVEAETFILDSEVVGFDSKTGKYKPFEAISQRIRRKYDIDKLVKELPVELDVFDVLYYNGKSCMGMPFHERRKIVEEIIDEQDMKIRPAVQIITDSDEKAQEFYEDALKIGEEGIMMKNLNATYRQGRRVGYMVKVKPVSADLDLVIVGAEYGSGKRGGWLTSYIVACQSGDGLLEVGKVSSGLKEKEEEGTTYDEMTKLLKPLIISEEGNVVKVKAKVVVAVTYQNVQESSAYSSGFALRFPRISAYRPDKPLKEIATLADMNKEAKKAKR